MTTVAGYQNAVDTDYGVANFWVLTGFHFDLLPAMRCLITLSGYPTQADAGTDALPIGLTEITIGAEDVGTMFGGAQSLMEAAIIGSSADWENAVYVPSA